jgi:hypothetical protein
MTVGAAGQIFPVQANKLQPKTYECRRTAVPIRVDGKLDDRAWKKAKWTTDFMDIEGAGRPKPRFRTRVKMQL